MPRVALPDSCSNAGYLGDSTLHTIKIDIVLPAHGIVDFEDYRRPLHSTYLSRSYWVSSDTGHC
jgi:hypothetical protein